MERGLIRALVDRLATGMFGSRLSEEDRARFEAWMKAVDKTYDEHMNLQTSYQSAYQALHAIHQGQLSGEFPDRLIALKTMAGEALLKLPRPPVS